MQRQYRTTNEDFSEIIVNLPDGRTARVGNDWRDLPDEYHRAAVQAGCEVKRGSGSTDEPVSSKTGPAAGTGTLSPAGVGSDEAVKEALKAMLEEENPKNFHVLSGQPDLKLLAKKAGFAISAEQARACLEQLVRDAGHGGSDQAARDKVARSDGQLAVSRQAEADAQRETIDPARGATVQVAGKSSLVDSDNLTEAEVEKRDARKATVKKAVKKVAKKTAEAKKPKKSAARA